MNIVLVLGILGFIAATVIVIAGSVVFMSQANVKAAQLNRQKNAPISSGYAIPVTVVIVAIFLMGLLLGFLPPLLRR